MKISNEIFQQIFTTSESQLDLLYKEEAVCLFAFRILPHLCQQIITRIINIDEDILNKDIKWTDIFQEPLKESKHYIRILFQIKILTQFEKLVLNPDFKRNIKKIFTSGLTPMNMVFKSKRKDYTSCLKTGVKALQKYLKNIFTLDQYPIQQSENEHLIFLQSIKFIRKDSSLYKLTPNAINFLLSPKQLQVRNIIGRYIINYQNKMRNTPEGKTNVVSFICLIFKICTLEIGAVFYELPPEYSKEFYEHLKYMRNFGVIRAKKDGKIKNKKYYVTPLIKCLFEDMHYDIEQHENSQFLFVETNFKIYAYTKNEFEINVLEFLFEIEYSFPEFIVGYITRSSIRQVLKKGVNSHVILQYISMHAHPKVDSCCTINVLNIFYLLFIMIIGSKVFCT